MNCVRYVKAVLLFAVITAVFGCKSNQDKSSATGGVPQEKAVTNPAASQDKNAAPAMAPLDTAVVRTAAARVIAQIKAGDFTSIYKEAAPGFKQIGTESQFVAKFQEARQKVGDLNDAKEISYNTRPDASCVLIYRLENGRFKSDFRLTFSRAQAGKVELAGLNQHDEPK